MSATSFSLPVKREEDRFACAAEGVRIARWAGLSDRAQQELAIAIAELVSNAVRHAGGGEVSIREISGRGPKGEPRRGVEVIVRDAGPGIDPRLVTEEAAAALGPRLPGQGLGVGLGAVHRLMSSVTILSNPGVRTEVIAIKWP
ncbi:MAG: ATP-binding protein [Polyangiaceae bacterium]|nr:ATP-binding protein [Polyangiaceae bacterium]